VNALSDPQALRVMMNHLLSAKRTVSIKWT